MSKTGMGLGCVFIIIGILSIFLGFYEEFPVGSSPFLSNEGMILMGIPCVLAGIIIIKIDN